MGNVPWYLLRHVNAAIEIYLENGFLTHYEKMNNFLFLLRHHLPKQSTGVSDEDLTMDLAFVWQGLAAGLGLSAFVFVAERVVDFVCCA